ncbi:MAG: pyrimidine-nucleoside phosphorylase [Chloroflexi bacterium]|nr:pyrimidine-nucleoside phosphorylase [Chloroflexota bacterium]MCC6893546.1 pyrimidine-nucleoside phosphorylase [Anaerolineae bacterium]
MRAVDLIAKKRDGLALTKDEIAWFVESYTRGDLPDYQASAMLMAIFLKGMSREETVNLTLSMAYSGDVLDLSDLIPYAVDKHSSGGIGDKTTLVVLPLVASCGVPVAKMSGRGLGYSGGTIDKLEAISGYQVNLSNEEFRRLVRENAIVLTGQSKDLAPADGKIYALRDVTATVPCLPLIASSIMSKKIAAGANGIVLDVKVGRGAFMTNLDDARELAQIMVDIGVDAGRDMIAVLSDMNQPLGAAVGNALEVVEAIDCLQGNGPADFREHCLDLAAYMLRLAGQGKKWNDDAEIRGLLTEQLSNGQAFARFRSLVQGQGGDVGMVDDPSRLPKAPIIETFTASQSGYVAQVAAELIGMAAFGLGAGREKKGDPIDLAVGLEVHAKVGDKVESGAPLVTIHARKPEQLATCRSTLQQAITFSDSPVEPLPLFYGTIFGR